MMLAAGRELGVGRVHPHGSIEGSDPRRAVGIARREEAQPGLRVHTEAGVTRPLSFSMGSCRGSYQTRRQTRGPRAAAGCFAHGTRFSQYTEIACTLVLSIQSPDRLKAHVTLFVRASNSGSGSRHGAQRRDGWPLPERPHRPLRSFSCRRAVAPITVLAAAAVACTAEPAP